MPHKNPEVRKAYLEDWRERNREHLREFDKTRNKNPERRKSLRATYAKRELKSTDHFRKFKYGITKEQYDAKVAKQGNKCGLCGRPEHHINYRTGRIQGLAVDHDHETGKNRDLLCGDCNRGIGLFDESPELLLKAIEYLNRHKGGPNG